MVIWRELPYYKSEEIVPKTVNTHETLLFIPYYSVVSKHIFMSDYNSVLVTKLPVTVTDVLLGGLYYLE